jgi:hypothetical protein
MTTIKAYSAGWDDAINGKSLEDDDTIRMVFNTEDEVRKFKEGYQMGLQHKTKELENKEPAFFCTRD